MTGHHYNNTSLEIAREFHSEKNHRQFRLHITKIHRQLLLVSGKSLARVGFLHFSFLFYRIWLCASSMSRLGPEIMEVQRP